jgi:hypothetical protein
MGTPLRFVVKVGRSVFIFFFGWKGFFPQWNLLATDLGRGL